MALDRLRGMRYEEFKIHDSGRVSVYLYRGDRGAMIATAEWRDEHGHYWLEPTASARRVSWGDAGGLWLPDLAACVEYAKGWE